MPVKGRKSKQTPNVQYFVQPSRHTLSKHTTFFEQGTSSNRLRGITTYIETPVSPHKRRRPEQECPYPLNDCPPSPPPPYATVDPEYLNYLIEIEDDSVKRQRASVRPSYLYVFAHTHVII